MGPTSPQRAALDRAISILGGVGAAAKRLKVTPQAIHKWRKKQVPSGRVLEIEAATGGQVTRQELRPDLYPVEAARAAPAALSMSL